MKIIDSKPANTAFITEYIYNGFNINEVFFLDIETTGLSASNCMIYLIGILYFDNDWKIKQFFLDNAADEKEMLIQFADFIRNKGFKNVIHYNGATFDVKFIESHCTYYDIDFSFKDIIQIDLYKYFTKYKSSLNLTSLKQKDIENKFSIKRKDIYSGKELIKLYKEYLLNHKSEYENDHLLHNYEDIVNLPILTTLLTFEDLSKGNYKILDFKNINTFIIELNSPLPEFFNGNEYVKINQLKENTYEIEFGEVVNATLKHFYDDYKNYYYLPSEDMAVHKSMATFIDKEKRIKANKLNCYTKLSSIFVLLPSNPLLHKKYDESTKSIFDSINVFKDENENSYILQKELESDNLKEKIIKLILY